MNHINDYQTTTNIAHICGEVIDGAKLSHQTYGEAFYTFTMGIFRNSGFEDKVKIMMSERLLATIDLAEGMFLEIKGQIRTYNEAVEGRNRLNIVVFVQEFSVVEDICEYINDIHLEGYICKSPLSRTSPLGRRICDLMLAVNRMYNKSDYIPCIAWGRNAIYSGTLDIGDKISITGRLQSRQYKKRTEDGDVLLKTAYEVSVLKLESLAE